MSSEESKAAAVSIGGSSIFHHTEAKPFQAPQGEECIEQISAHIETHLGEVESVFHEIVSDTVHIDVHLVKPTENFPFARLVTSGMSDLPMAIPSGAEASRYAELMITLRGDWQLDQQSFKEEKWYWPVRLLKELARLPHKYDTWLAFGHTVPNGDPAEPYALDTKLCGAIIVPSPTVPDGFHQLRIHEHKQITFFAVVPLYAEEMRLKLRDGSEKLLDKFVEMNVSDIVDPSRRNVARKRFGFF